MSTTLVKYLLDTSVLIEAFKSYYEPSLVSTFWERLAEQSRIEVISSIDKVRSEIHPKNTFLTDWANNNFAQWESTTNVDTMDWYEKLIQWSTTHSQFNVNAKNEFASENKADPWLIAHAMATGCVVVTEEVFNHDIKRKIPIPNVCEAFDIPYMNTFQMLHELGIRLA